VVEPVPLPGTEEQRVTTLRDVDVTDRGEPRTLFGAERAVCAGHRVRDGGGIEPGDMADTLVALERESRREGRDGPLHAATQHALAEDRLAELDEVVGGGDGNEKRPVTSQDTPELARVHARRDRDDRAEGRVGVGEESVGVRDDPLKPRVSLRRRLDRRGRDVDAVGLASEPLADDREVIAIPASNVEHGVLTGEGQQSPYDLHERGHDSTGEQAPSRRAHLGGVSGPTRLPILGLQEVDVAAARDVEGVALPADYAALDPRKRQLAAPHGAEEGDEAA